MSGVRGRAGATAFGWWPIGALALLAGLLAGCRSVDQADLGLGATDVSSCVRTDIISEPEVIQPGNNYNQEQIANVYLLYAIAALNAYEYPASDGRLYESNGAFTGFTLQAYDRAWIRQERITKPGGLALDYYFNDADPAVFKVLIAFRGTENSVGDWLANLSWLTQWVPIADQYDRARQAVMEIRERAKAAAHGKHLSSITTGHSLGGGLAEHIAYAFPCTSAVVFDSSFVVNRNRLAQPFADIQEVYVFDKQDELTRVRDALPLGVISPTARRYGINPVAQGGLQHRSIPLAVGMARMVAMCRVDAEQPRPGCLTTDARVLSAKRLYCGSKYADEEQHEPQCRT